MSFLNKPEMLHHVNTSLPRGPEVRDYVYAITCVDTRAVYLRVDPYHLGIDEGQTSTGRPKSSRRDVETIN